MASMLLRSDDGPLVILFSDYFAVPGAASCAFPEQDDAAKVLSNIID